MVLPHIDPTQQPFHFTCLDVLAYQIDNASIWKSYDTNLMAHLLDKSPADPTLRFWMRKIVDAPLTHHTLLYRHSIMARVMAEEPTLPTYPYLYALLASLCAKPAIFAGVLPSDLWDKLDKDPTPINILRQRRPHFVTHLRQLANREDVTDDRLLTDHGLLSSFTLVYGLTLIQIVVKYHQTLHPRPATGDLIQLLSDTLAELKRSVHS